MQIQRNNKYAVNTGGFAEVLRIALPLVLSSSCHAVNMFVDRLMLVQYSQEAVAASFTGGLTNFAIACLLVGTIGYTGTFVAQYEGARQPEKIGSAVWQGIWLSVIGGAFMATGVWWGRPLFECFHHDPAVTEQEIAYFAVLCEGCFVFLSSGAISCFWSGRGRTVLVMLISVLTTVINIPFNWLLIFGKCGFPELGVEGAAWGTVIADGVGCLVYFVLFFLPSARRHFHTGNFRVDWKLLRRMLHFGLPNGIQLTLDMTAFTAFSILLGSYGVAVHEASSITFGINNISFCPVIGFGMAASIMVGQAVGAENIPLARKAVRNCLLLVLAYTCLMIVLFTLFQDVVLAPFVRPGDASQAEAMRLSRCMLYFVSAYLFVDGFGITYSNAIRGAGDTRFTMWVFSTVGLCGLALPSYILYRMQMPWWSLWICLDAEVILLGIIFTLRYRAGKWEKMRVIEAEAPAERCSDAAGNGKTATSGSALK